MGLSVSGGASPRACAAIGWTTISPKKSGPHIAQRRQSLIDGGMDPQQAGREARRLFGNQTVITERARESWTIPTLSSLAQDVRYAIRVARRSPGYAAAVIVTIALGTALNGAVFVLINAFMLRPPEVVDIDRVVRLDDGRPALGPTYPDYVDYRDRAADAMDLAAYAGMSLNARIDRGDGRRRARAGPSWRRATTSTVLKVRASVGRTFDGRADLPPLGTAEAVIGERYWTRRFNRDPAVIGRSIELNDQPFTIVGVVPASFRGVDIPGSEAAGRARPLRAALVRAVAAARRRPARAADDVVGAAGDRPAAPRRRSLAGARPGRRRCRRARSRVSGPPSRTAPVRGAARPRSTSGC